MALLAVITAVVGVVTSLIIAVGSAVQLPAGLTTALSYGFEFVVAGIGFLHNLFSDSFWSFVSSGITLIVAAHAAYFAYSLGISVWRIFMGGGD